MFYKCIFLYFSPIKYVKTHLLPWCNGSFEYILSLSCLCNTYFLSIRNWNVEKLLFLIFLLRKRITLVQDKTLIKKFTFTHLDIYFTVTITIKWLQPPPSLLSGVKKMKTGFLWVCAYIWSVKNLKNLLSHNLMERLLFKQISENYF